MAQTIGKTIKVATISSFGTLTAPTKVKISRSGSICISDGAGKIIVFDADPVSGTFASRVELTDTGNFGADFAIYGPNAEYVVVGTPNHSSNLGRLTHCTYSFTTNSWTKLSVVGSVASGSLGSRVVALQDDFILACASGENSSAGRIRHFRRYKVTTPTPAFVFEEYTQRDTSLMVGSRLDSTNGGLVVVGNPTASSGAGQISLFYQKGFKWEKYGTDITGSAGSALGTFVAISRDGFTVAAVNTTGVRLYTVDTISPGVGLTVKTTATISATGVVSIDLTGDGFGLFIAKATSYETHEYLNLSEQWAGPRLSVTGLTSVGAVSCADSSSNLCAVLYNSNGFKVDVFLRRSVSSVESLIATADAASSSPFPITIDGQNVSAMANEDFITRGLSVTAHRGLTVVEQKIIEAIRALKIESSLKVESIPRLLSDLLDVDISASTNNQGAGKLLTFSDEKKQWVDDGAWWEDLRFPLTIVPDTSTAFGSNLQVGYTYADPTNSAIVFRANSCFTSNPFTDGEGVTVLAQMPHAWLEGTELRPHLHWVQQRAYNANFILLVRVVKNGEVDTFNTTGLLPTSADADGVAGDYIFYRGENVFAYPGSGTITQITSFKRFNKVTNTFTSQGIDATGMVGSTMLACIICRDSLNTSGMFNFQTPGQNPTTLDEIVILDANNNPTTGSTNLNDVPVYEFDIHYQIGSAGSASEIPEKRQVFEI
jgi:acetolactate synthase regulatory subunit